MYICALLIETTNNNSMIRKEKMLRKEVEILKLAARKRIENIMGKGKVISEVFDIVEEYAHQDCALLFEGETGVGKKEIITYLHSISLIPK